MDIRTKLALALVSMSLLSMFVLGWFAYETSSDLLRQVSERQLDALAESKQRDLERVIQGWRDRVELIRSRTRLRQLMARKAKAADANVEDEIRRIVRDAVASVQGVDRVTLYDPRGDLVITVGSNGIAPRLDARVFEESDSVHYAGTEPQDDGRVLVRFQAAMTLGDRVIGAIETIIEAEDLRSVTQNYTGLGETGESIVVMRHENEATARVLTPLRHAADLHRIDLAAAPYLAAALAGDETVFRSGVRDYRGSDVWCATRSLPSVNWGLVVKIDSAEESRRADWLWAQLFELGLALGAVAILGGTLLGFRLGKPLRDLKELVERIRSGERNLRADASASDEVGFLADALNDLLDEQELRR